MAVASPERDALMGSVIADLEDDTPRLVLADWLDENGDQEDRDRATLIRAQVEIADKYPYQSRLCESNPHVQPWVGGFFSCTANRPPCTACFDHRERHKALVKLEGSILTHYEFKWRAFGECSFCKGKGVMDPGPVLIERTAVHTWTCQICEGCGDVGCLLLQNPINRRLVKLGDKPFHTWKRKNYYYGNWHHKLIYRAGFPDAVTIHITDLFPEVFQSGLDGRYLGAQGIAWQRVLPTLTKVHLDGIEPFFDETGSVEWWDIAGTGDTDAGSVPTFLFNIMWRDAGATMRNQNDGDRWISFRQPDEARDALALAACEAMKNWKGPGG